MAAKEFTADSVDSVIAKAEEFSGKNVYILFTGASDASTGNSWCPDCVKADPVIQKCIPQLTEDDVFILCTVGDRASWKDPKSLFRTHPKLRLKGVPTLMKWNTPERLGPDDCSKQDLVSMLFSE